MINLINNNLKTKITNAFNKAARTYDNHAIAQHEIGKRLIQRLGPIKISAENINILDLGSGTGFTSKLLKQAYPNANIYLLDIATNMLQEAPNDFIKINADMELLPFLDNSIDIIFSNFSMQWAEELTKVINECQRILKTNGLLIFTIPGHKTLYELKACWDNIEPKFKYINNFFEMHNLGDGLLKSKFTDPVLQTEQLTLTYNSVVSILKDLKKIGATVSKNTNNFNFIGKTKLNSLAKYYENFRKNNKLPVTYDVIYAHAFKIPKQYNFKHQNQSETLVPIEVLFNK